MYYLKSRFYDPETGRFVSADDVDTLSTEHEDFSQYNLYAYCFNNPVNRTDEDGTWPKWAKKVAIGVAVIAVAAAVTVATGGAGAGVAGYIAAGALKGAVIGGAIGAATGAVGGAVSHRISTGSWKGAGKAALNGAATGFMTGAVAGAVTGGASGYAKYKNFGIEKVGKIKSSSHPKEHTYGVKYHYNRVKSHNKRVVNSFELHRPHNNRHNKWHWQLNRWKKNKSKPLSHWRIWGKRWR